jgi:hypothetical protein
MNVEDAEGRTNHTPNDSGTAPPEKGDEPGHESHAHEAREFARRVAVFAKRLPIRVDEQVKRNPYAVLAVACGTSAAVGVVLSSRIMRAVLTAALTTAVVEVVRAAFRQGAVRGQGRAA